MPSLASSLKQSRPIGVDPRAKRFGFFPGLFLAEMECSVSGQQERTLPQGELIAFESTDLEVSNFDIAKSNWTPTKTENVTAEWFISNVKKTYGSQGFVEADALTSIPDDEVERVFNLVHPSFSAIGHKCPQGLTKTCAKCRIELLEGVKFDDESIAEKLRLQLLYSYVTYHDHARNRWAEVTVDLGRGLATLGGGEEHFRKNIHETALEERATAAADAYGKQTAAAQVEGMKAIAESLRGNQGSDKMAEAMMKIAESQAENNNLMRQMLANQNSVNATITDGKVDKRTKAYKESVANESSVEAGD